MPTLLRREAGLEFTQNGGVGRVGGLFVRGANPNQSLILVDGVRINSATAGTNAFENIPLAQIERIEVLRGPASSLYGARVEDFQEYHGLVSYALNDLNYRFFQIPNPPGWRTVGRPESPFRSRAGLFYPLFEAYLKRQGWQHRGLNYLIDEPQPNLYPAVEQAFGLAKGLAPTIKTLCAAWDPAPGFAKVINLWATPASRFREPEIAAARARGQEQWLYANRLHGLDHPPVHQRLIGWLLHRYQFPGYLAWGMNFWPQDPWTSVPGISLLFAKAHIPIPLLPPARRIPTNGEPPTTEHSSWTAAFQFGDQSVLIAWKLL